MKKATTNETTFICVKPIIKAEYTIRIVGDSPLLVHAWSEKAKKEMLQAQQGKKLLKKDKVAKNPAGECAEALYWLDGKPDIDYSDWTEDLLHQYGKTARFGFPACAVKAAAISAAYRIGAMKNKASGDWSTGAASGDYCRAEAFGKNSIAVVNGACGKACGALGCYLVLTEYDDDGHMICAKMARVDGSAIKENVYYTLKNGEFVEVKP